MSRVNLLPTIYIAIVAQCWKQNGDEKNKAAEGDEEDGKEEDSKEEDSKEEDSKEEDSKEDGSNENDDQESTDDVELIIASRACAVAVIKGC
ncbi:hypothetical protein MMC07_005611 [Pseudocyphellaria aurata]|nr:hypothetical protein [Pseudocyphellaria aurata]